MTFRRGLISAAFLLMALVGHAASIRVETASATGKPWRGLTAEAGNFLQLELLIPEASGAIMLPLPRFGTFSLTASIASRTQAPGSVQPDVQGRARVFYHSPPSLPEAASLAPSLTDSVSSGPSWIAIATLSFTWTPKASALPANQPARLDLPLAFCRPPVLLIHGFTGSRLSLASYVTALHEKRFDVVARDYFNQDISDRAGSSVEAQAERLATTIRETRTAWENLGFKTPRVDLIGHSLGGLIARQYLSTQPATASVPVRKLIMVATPNHGITWLERVAARLIAEFQAGKHQRAAEQLFSGSPLFKRLNAGEAAGRHLRPDVQYALIIGLRSRYEHFDLAGNLFGDFGTPADDDGVVTRASAQLNGVQTYVSGQVYHTFTPQLQQVFSRDAALTRSDSIEERLAKLLLLDIPRPPLAGSELIVRRVQGQTFQRRAVGEPWAFVGSWPVSLGSGWTAFKTQDGRALLGLSLKGNIWASVALPQNSELEIGYASPQLVQVRIVAGQARFTSMQAKTGRFEIVLGETASDWKEFQPRARVCNLDTDFTVEAGREITIRSREGRVAVQGIASDGRRLSRVIGSGSAIALDHTGKLRSSPSHTPSWCEDPFFDASNDEWDPNESSTSHSESAPMPKALPASSSMALIMGHDLELRSLFEQLHATLSEIASSGPIMTESGWSSDERRQRIISVTGKAGLQAQKWAARNSSIPLPLRLGVQYFIRRLGVLVDPTFTFNGDPRREAFFYAEFSRGRDDLLVELEAFVRPSPPPQPDQLHADRMVEGLWSTARALEQIVADPELHPGHPNGPKTWKDAWWRLARRVMSCSEEADLAARRFDGEATPYRLKYAAKYFKLRLKEIGRSSWEKQQTEEDWQHSFTVSSAEVSQTLTELNELITALR